MRHRFLLRAIVLATAALSLLLTSCGGSDTRLDATKLTLELGYRLDGTATANLEGQPGAAPAGATITCRRTQDRDWRLGQGQAGDDGSFDIELDARAWPHDDLSPDTFNQLNASLECRAGDGPWVQPLRMPRVAIE